MFYHGLKSGPVRIGTTEKYEVMDDGLYAEATISEGPEGDEALALVAAGRAAASSGTMPHLLRIEDDGYVSTWPIVEWSILDQMHAGSWPGTTTVAAIRAAGVDIETVYGDEMEVTHMTTNGAATQPQTDGTPDIASVVAELRQEIENLRAAPAAALPPTPPPPTDGPRVEVKSKYDDVSLFGLLHWDEHRRLNAARQGKVYKRDEAFMRALVDKTRKAREENHLRVDAQAYDAWHSKVPHLRADEAMASTLANSGDELVPTLLNSVAYYEFRLQSRVLSLLPSFQMASQPFDYPTISAGPKFRRAVEPEDLAQADVPNSYLTDGKPTTDKVVFSAAEIGVLSLASRTFFEDAGLNVADALSQQFARNAARDIDYVLLNGDERTTASNISHSADPTGTAYDLVLGIDGLRRIAQANSDSSAVGTIATGTIITAMALMGARGIIGTDVQNLAVIVDPGTYYKLLALADFKTMDLVGERAALITGQVGTWYGVPVVVSDELEYTDSNGLYPAAHNGTKGQTVLVHRNLNMVGYRRDLQMESGNVPHTGLYAMSATVRFDLQSMEAGSVSWLYNHTV